MVLKPSAFTGRCNCGGVTFTIEGPVLGSNYCHCETCRRQTGAPVFLGAKFAASKTVIIGETREYATSETGRRHFCSTCGSNLFFTFSSSPDVIEVLIGVLDQPGRIEPTHHVWTSTQIPWFEVADSLPRHAEMPVSVWEEQQ